MRMREKCFSFFCLFSIERTSIIQESNRGTTSDVDSEFDRCLFIAIDRFQQQFIGLWLASFAILIENSRLHNFWADRLLSCHAARRGCCIENLLNGRARWIHISVLESIVSAVLAHFSRTLLPFSTLELAVTIENRNNQFVHVIFHQKFLRLFFLQACCGQKILLCILYLLWHGLNNLLNYSITYSFSVTSIIQVSNFVLDKLLSSKTKKFQIKMFDSFLHVEFYSIAPPYIIYKSYYYYFIYNYMKIYETKISPCP